MAQETAPAELAKVVGPMNLSLRVWLYLQPEQRKVVSQYLAKFLTRELDTFVDHDATWTATPASKSEIEKATDSLETPPELKQATESCPNGKEIFTSVVITLRTEGIMNPAKRKSRADMFEDVLKSVKTAFHSKPHQFAGISWLDDKRIIAWSLRDPTSKQGITSPVKGLRRLDVWILPAPKNPATEKPAEKIEEFLYQLVNIKLRKPGKEYLKPIGGREVLQSIQDLLYQQKTMYGKLHDVQKVLENPELGEDSVLEHVNQYTGILEEIDQVLCSLIQIYERNVGKPNQKSKSESSMLRALCLLFLRLFKNNRQAYGSIKIDDDHLEQLKANARRELKGLQRVAPIIAAHARLHDLYTANALKKLCDEAKAGPERCELPSKIAIQPANLLNKQAQARCLAMVLAYYQSSHEKVIEQVEALDKFVGKKFAEEGPRIFRDKKDRNWVDPSYKPSEDEKKQGPKKGKFWKLLTKKNKKTKVIKGVDSDGDSDGAKSSFEEEWCEKA
ncbi:hypothetical protein V8F20_005935 [Naviculisporaceae sp. PSN 640]